MKYAEILVIKLFIFFYPIDKSTAFSSLKNHPFSHSRQLAADFGWYSLWEFCLNQYPAEGLQLSFVHYKTDNKKIGKIVDCLTSELSDFIKKPFNNYLLNLKNITIRIRYKYRFNLYKTNFNINNEFINLE